jgi:hypothetical protein
MAIVQGSTFADLMRRAPVFDKEPFMGVVGANLGATASLTGQVINAKSQLEAVREQGRTLAQVEKIRREANRPTAGDRLRAMTPFLMDSFQSMGGNRLAGDLLGVQLAQTAVTPSDLLGMIRNFQGGLNDSRALIDPWTSGSQTGAAALLRTS